MADLRLRPAAEGDLETIFRAGREQWGEAQAIAYMTGLLDKLDMLASFPGLARERREITPPVRMHPHGAHLVIYMETAGGVEIVRVLHARQDWIGLFSDPA